MHMEHCKLSFFSSSSFPLCFLCLLFMIFQYTANSSDLIDEVCRAGAKKSSYTWNYEFCVTSLQANPYAKRSDLEELGMIAVRLAMANATNTIESIKRMLGSKDFDKHTTECLEDCRDLYGAAIPRLEEAVDELMGNGHADVNILISGAMELPTACADGFVEDEVASPLSNENYNMFQLCDISLFITDTLSSQHLT